MKTDLAWQLPLIFQCFTSVIICAFIFVIPESPRFLMSRGREEEAHAFLTRFHGGGDPNAPIVKLELEEMRNSYQENKMEAWYDYSPLVATHSGRWRLLQVS